MPSLAATFLAWCDALRPARFAFARYWVTPRQGRYVVRRRILRELQGRTRIEVARQAPGRTLCHGR